MTQSATFLPKDCFDIKGRGVVATGKLTSGMLAKGMTTTILGKPAQIGAIESFRKSWETISSTDLPAAEGIGLLLSGITKEDISSVIQQHATIEFQGNPLPAPTQPVIASPSTQSSNKRIMMIILLCLFFVSVVFFFF
ncbi:hypothetical protein HY468_05385 [Candidatus Roizmanbacteria bacterium]|nr:hypothetical protein [Candidatus Roizmanbacteria bacterium]